MSSCLCREVQLVKKSALAQEDEKPAVAIARHDGRPGMQPIGTTVARDLPSVPSRRSCVAHDHEYVRHGTLSFWLEFDPVIGAVHVSVEENIVRASSSPSCRGSRTPIRHQRRSKLILGDQTHPPLSLRVRRSTFVFGPHGSRLLLQAYRLGPAQLLYRLQTRIERSNHGRNRQCQL